MSWKTQREQLADGVVRFSFEQQACPLSYAEVIELWIDSPDFCRYFSGQLADTSMAAFFWETPPVTRKSIDRRFECVLIDAPSLYTASPQPQAFAEHFGNCSQSRAAVSFSNLGNDAMLVSPCPSVPATACVHLAQFLRHAGDAEKVAFWRQVGMTVRERLGEQPLWLSTCGSGVYWLHVRLDSTPKYYRYSSYVNWSA